MSFFDDKIRVSFEGMLMAFTDALDLVDERLTDHHKQVAYICYELCQHMHKDPLFTKEVVMLGLVHDIGAFREDERNRMVSFEVENVMDHAITGYLLLRSISFYAKMSEAILYHHTHYRQGENFRDVDSRIAEMAQMLFIADRVSVLVLTGEHNILAIAGEVVEEIEFSSGSLFNPLYVEVIRGLRKYDFFWLNIVSKNKDFIINDVINKEPSPISYDIFKEFTRLFIYSIDFRSRYTATHSKGVSAVAKALATYHGMSMGQAELVEIAGCFHDIGKLMIPDQILDKPAGLNFDEYNLIKQHPYYTGYILDRIDGMEEVKNIAASHHEMTDGEGYPYRLEMTELTDEAMLLTIADIFTALSEKRPYRDGSTVEEIRRLFTQLAKNNKINEDMAETAIKYCSELHQLNMVVQSEMNDEFETITAEREHLRKFLESTTKSVF